MRGISAVAMAIALLGGCDGPPDKSTPETAKIGGGQMRVQEAWVRLPAAPGRPGAAYFTIRANGRPATLERITSPRVERIELHETVEQDGVSRMNAMPGVPPQDDVISFLPGGKHAMLFGIDPTVKAGDRIPLTFSLRPGPAITAEAEVHAAGDAPHPNH